MNEKRSQSRENLQMPIFGEAHTQRVGVRHAPTLVTPMGGGYQDVCSALNSEKKIAPADEHHPPRDPRLDDLRRMGMPNVWLRVAERIGVDAFLSAWKVIDEDKASWHNETILRLRLRPYRSYLRFQRNRFIEVLALHGLKPIEIKRRLAAQFGEDVSRRHITRLSRAVKLP